MTSRIQLLALARAFGKDARVFDCLGRIRSYAGTAEVGQEYGLFHIVDMFYTGLAQTFHEKKSLVYCNSCHGMIVELALPKCRLAGGHDAHSPLRYSRSKYGPRTYMVGEDGLRPQYVTDLQIASHRKSIEKSKGVGKLK